MSKQVKLVVGKGYGYKSYKFRYNVPVEVTDDDAKYLLGLGRSVKDHKQVLSKSLFEEVKIEEKEEPKEKELVKGGKK